MFREDGDRVKRYTLAPAVNKHNFAVGAKHCKPMVLPPNHTQPLPHAWLAESEILEGDELKGAGANSVSTPSLHSLVHGSCARSSKSDIRTPSLHTIFPKLCLERERML